LVPRVLCFVKPVADAKLNLAAPFVRTSDDVLDDAKKPWTMQIEGQVESKYFFGTVLARDLMPFVVRKFSLVALPLLVTSKDDLVMIDAAEALSQGEKHAYDWFSQTEGIWKRHRKDAELSFAGRLDYQRTLTSQKVRAKYCVIYNQSGTNISASLVTKDESKRIGEFPISGYVIDSKTYYHYAKTEDEAHYLVGILNSTFVNDAIKPLQPEGLMGARDIHRRPFEACDISLFDPKNLFHQRIADIAREAREELLKIVRKMETPVSRARGDARHLVANQLHKLDKLVTELLKNKTVKYPDIKSGPMRLMELFAEKS
jgi:hypothetical protein